MIDVRENVPDVDDDYLRCLNVCFPGAWREIDYHWYMKRLFASRAPDVATVHKDGEMVAGMGVNYRTLDVPGIGKRDVGIFTAAWALPEHQGHWHFGRLIRAARRIAREKGCVASLSFVTADNASATVLRRAGAHALPTYYLHASPGAALDLPDGLPAPEEVPACSRSPFHDRVGIRFHYPDDEEWRKQMISRPHDTISLRVANGFAVVECAMMTDRLQFVSAPGDGSSVLAAIVRWTLDRGRSFFHFTTSELVVGEARERGLTVRPGYIMLLDLCEEERDDAAELTALLRSRWQVQAGDRM